jgi:hypothetical protein
MDENKPGKLDQMTFLPIVQAENACCSTNSCCDTAEVGTTEEQLVNKTLRIDLLVIDLETCARCVPTGDQLQTAVNLLSR